MSDGIHNVILNTKYPYNTVIKDIWQWNKGQSIVFSGMDLTSNYEVHFKYQALNDLEEPIPSTIKVDVIDNKVIIPDDALIYDDKVFGFLYYKDENGILSETIARIDIVLLKRDMPWDYVGVNNYKNLNDYINILVEDIYNFPENMPNGTKAILKSIIEDEIKYEIYVKDIDGWHILVNSASTNNNTNVVDKLSDLPETADDGTLGIVRATESDEDLMYTTSYDDFHPYSNIKLKDTIVFPTYIKAGKGEDYDPEIVANILDPNIFESVLRASFAPAKVNEEYIDKYVFVLTADEQYAYAYSPVTLTDIMRLGQNLSPTTTFNAGVWYYAEMIGSAIQAFAPVPIPPTIPPQEFIFSVNLYSLALNDVFEVSSQTDPELYYYDAIIGKWIKVSKDDERIPDKVADTVDGLPIVANEGDIYRVRYVDRSEDDWAMVNYVNVERDLGGGNIGMKRMPFVALYNRLYLNSRLSPYGGGLEFPEVIGARIKTCIYDAPNAIETLFNVVFVNLGFGDLLAVLSMSTGIPEKLYLFEDIVDENEHILHEKNHWYNILSFDEQTYEMTLELSATPALPVGSIFVSPEVTVDPSEAQESIVNEVISYYKTVLSPKPWEDVDFVRRNNKWVERV